MTSTTLSAGVAATDGSISVASAADFPAPPFNIAVNREEMLVFDTSGTTFSVQRGEQQAVETLALVDFEVDQADGWPDPTDGSGAKWRGDLSDADSTQLSTGGKGSLNIFTAGVSKSTNLEVPAITIDHQLRYKFSIDTLDFLVDAQVRWISVDDYYRARLTVSGAGAMSLRLAAVVTNVATNLAAAVVPAGTIAANDEVNLALQVTGSGTTSVAAKAWRTVDGEPSAWDTTATDTSAILQDAGRVAIRYRPTTTGTELVDDLIVSRIPVGIAHSSGDTVVLIDPWPVGELVTGHGPPSANPKTGSKYLDIDAASPVEYTRVGTTWYSVTLT